MSVRNPDFIARLHYHKEGGRTLPVYSGYRPHIEFESIPECLTSGSQVFLDKEEVNAGDSVTAEITILSVEYMKGRLYEGKKFVFCEGSREIGTGEIIEIVNKTLEKK